MKVHAIADEALGNTSYLVELGGGLAASVDPRRDVEEHLRLADQLDLRIVVSAETHLHADFVSGSLELAAVSGAEVVTPAAGAAHIEHTGVRDGDRLARGGATLRVMATPGHTPEHVAYVLETDEGPVGVFSGGSLIAGGAARTDLVSTDLTESLARDQFRSLRRIAELPDATALWPTHGGGSFCSAFPSTPSATAVGDQRFSNPLLNIADEDEFVRRLLAGYGSFPGYFLRLRDVNQQGPCLVRALAAPQRLEPHEVADRTAGGAWLVDARPVDEWAKAHPAGAVSIELRPAFASWLGWIVPFDAPVVLVIDEARLREAVTLAQRIGYDHVVGWLGGGVEAWRAAGHPVSSIERVDAARAVALASDGWTMVDVRQRSELETSRIRSALHIELGDIAAGKVPDADRVVTFCGHGERAATAASLLEGRGLTAASLAGGVAEWEQAGGPVER